jgi:hypothetical protein
MTAIPSGRRNSLPGPEPIATGTTLHSAAKVVITIGRNRCTAASTIACTGASPCWRSACKAKSTIMIAFFLTMPIKKKIPISAISDSSVPVTINASSAPSPAEGKVERIVNGWR